MWIVALCNTLFSFKTEFILVLSSVETENPEAGSISVEFVRHTLMQCAYISGVPVKCKIIPLFTWFREQRVQGFPARLHLMLAAQLILAAHLTIFRLQYHRRHT